MKKIQKIGISAAMSAIIAFSPSYISEFAAGMTAFAGYGDDYMVTQPEFMQRLYEGLCEGIEEIAAGKRTSSVISVKLPTPVPFDYAAEVYNNSALLEAILAEYPYELFWFDFTEETGGLFSVTDSIIVDDEQLFTSIDFYLPVVQAYMGEDDYSVDSEKIAATAKAVENAKAIVEENKDKSDYEKLKAYKDTICELVTYDHEAIENSKDFFGDPWQLVYVFDNDPATNVVCEGYSKAFHFLCDITDFEDKTVRCAQITGVIYTDDALDAHMWNIVTIGGKSYHVDVTNCDENTIGEGDYLFMKGADSTNEVGCSFTIEIPGYEPAELGYLYDDYCFEFYDSNVLMVSTEDYISEEPELTGMCGDDIAWLLYRNEDGKTYTLNIDGTGKMYSYNADEIPWKEYNEKITDIVVGADVEKIAAYIFINPFDTPVPANRRIKVIINDAYSWIIDGSDLTAIQGANIYNLDNADPDVSGLRGVSEVEFYTEDTNLPTSLEFYFDEEYAGNFANLYVEIDGKLCFMETAKLDEDGTVLLPDVSKMGVYAVMICEYSDLPGDTDNDGVLTAKDAATLLRSLIGLEKADNSAMGDFNGDGEINARDAAAILRKLITKG